MTETDATKRPLEMPESFLPYLEKYRIYKLFKDMLQDLLINLPRDHLKHMKMFVRRHIHSSKDVDRVVLLISPELQIDTKKLVRDMIKDIGFFVITRRCVMDRYEKHESYKPGCVSPATLSEVTKLLTLIDPVPQAGWLMYDHPCTVSEARCLQQDGVLPTVTLVLEPAAPPPHNPFTRYRSFHHQDFEGLKIAYKATLKEVHVANGDSVERVAARCVRGVRAAAAGAQGAGRGALADGAPGVRRALLLGPAGSGRGEQARAAARHFGLVYYLYNEALVRDDGVGAALRQLGVSAQMKADIVKRRIARKDCIDHGWVLTGYPACGVDFEHLDRMPTPPNRIIFLNVPRSVCEARLRARGTDRPGADQIDVELDYYFSEYLAELRAAAGITAVEVDGNKPSDEVQVKVQAAIMASPIFNIESCAQLRNVLRADELMY